MTGFNRKRHVYIGFAVYCLLMVSVSLVPLDVLRGVRVGYAVAACLAAWLFVIVYQVKTRGHWRDSEHGFHLMAFTFAVSVILTYVVAALFYWVPIWLLPYVSAWIYLTMGALMLWRVSILWSDQRTPLKAPPR